MKEKLEQMGYCLAPKKLVEEKKAVCFMYRETPDEGADSGWRFFAGDETDEEVNVAENIGLYAVKTIADLDPSIIPLLANEAGCAFERANGQEAFRSIEEA